MDNTPDSIVLPKNYSILLLNIITVISKRGGFNPEEFKAVGELFDYVKKELKIDSLQDNSGTEIQ